jgi:hypothetical protein
MAFIHQVLANLETDAQTGRSQMDRDREQIAVPYEVRRFAPKKARSQPHSRDEHVRCLEAENASWRERAMYAEARLKQIERTIQSIAARVRSPQFK